MLQKREAVKRLNCAKEKKSNTQTQGMSKKVKQFYIYIFLALKGYATWPFLILCCHFFNEKK